MKFRLITISIVCIAISLFLQVFSNSILQYSQEYFPIKKVAVAGELKFTQQQEIEAAVAGLLDKGFFLIDLAQVKQDLVKLPWVSKVLIQRKWPDQINILISEYIPVAVWNNYAVVTQENRVIYPDQLPNVEGLPTIFAATTEVSGMLDIYLAIMSKVAPFGLRVESLSLMQDNGLRADLSNGVEIILGQDNLQAKLSRFVLAYKNAIKIVESKVAYVDLRYINGIAIGWKSG